VKPADMNLLTQDLMVLKVELETIRAQYEQIEVECNNVLHQHDHYGATLAALLPLLEPTIEHSLTTIITSFQDTKHKAAEVESPTVHVKQGNLMKLTLTNGEFVQHDFVIDELSVHSPHVMPGPNNTVTLIFLTTEPGEYTYYCSIPGHREAGMEGTLVVELDEGMHMEHEEGTASEETHSEETHAEETEVHAEDGHGEDNHSVN
jgi:uncharacterized cupredoxin-like copper-binding protein